MRTIDADVLKIDIVEEGQRSRRYKLCEIWELNRDEIYKVIDKQPTIESEPRWIKCSDHLPEAEVLCCDIMGEMIIGYPYQDDESETGYSAESDDVCMYDCIAWMEKPEPYKEGGVV